MKALTFPRGSQGDSRAVLWRLFCSSERARWVLYLCAQEAEKRVRAALPLAQVSAFLRVNVTADAVISVFLIEAD